MKQISLKEIAGFSIGHDENIQAATGCTVILCESGATAGVDVRGGAPGTRETDLLQSGNLVDAVHGVFLSGGSAYGLDVGSGIMKFLEERQIGFDVQVAKVPIVTGAVLFDLAIGSSEIRPDYLMGYRAAQHAQLVNQFVEGNIGAGTGATVGKCLGPDHAMKGGLGIYAVQVGDLKIGAIVAVNCFGDVIDPTSNEIIAGVYDYQLEQYLNSEKQLLNQIENESNTNRFQGNTAIGTIITNAKLTKSQANKVASMAHDGFARTMRPSHTMVDGDTIFAMSCGDVEADLNIVGMLAASVIETAVINGVKKAQTLDAVIGYASM
ncbi:P1 family peptidase [Aquibacillus saliphilus]|uniref:P1 family peptidase n=1 Tax=Aquibacillus saliphilus TaxID=1909422 RepID=UPI001CF0873A|nr:P1 family peptidase [Aquibacillus saliphilus]